MDEERNGDSDDRRERSEVDLEHVAADAVRKAVKWPVGRSFLRGSVGAEDGTVARAEEPAVAGIMYNRAAQVGTIPSIDDEAFVIAVPDVNALLPECLGPVCTGDVHVGASDFTAGEILDPTDAHPDGRIASTDNRRQRIEKRRNGDKAGDAGPGGYDDT
jgi:hypothetical protein